MPCVGIEGAALVADAPGAPSRRTRKAYEASFKLQVVQHALSLPTTNRIKPTCRMFPGVEPVQVRKWIRSYAALQKALPTAKLLHKSLSRINRTDDVRAPDLAAEEASETESLTSSADAPAAASPCTVAPPAVALSIVPRVAPCSARQTSVMRAGAPPHPHGAAVALSACVMAMPVMPYYSHHQFYPMVHPPPRYVTTHSSLVMPFTATPAPPDPKPPPRFGEELAAAHELLSLNIGPASSSSSNASSPVREMEVH